MLTKTKLAGMMLGAALLLAGAGTARADDCNSRARKEQRDLNRAIEQHGFFSPQANRERNELRRIQNNCGWLNNRDWDRDDSRWRRGDGDWDRDDSRWRRGDGDNDRDDRWVGRRGDGDRDRDDRGWRDRDRDRDHDRGRHRGRDRDRDHDRDHDRDRH
jgi:hypothetical protein